MKRLLLCIALVLLSAPTARAVSIADFGGQPGGSDTTPAFNAALAATTDGRVTFGPGQYFFLSAPDPIPANVTVEGAGMMLTCLVRTFQGGTFLHFAGAGQTVRRLCLWAADGTHGGTAVAVVAQDSEARPTGYQVFEDLLVTGGGTWEIPLLLDGSRKLIAPIGVRLVMLRNVRLLNATRSAAEWINCIACEWYGGGAWQGGGSTQAVRVGGPVSQKNRILADVTTEGILSAPPSLSTPATLGGSWILGGSGVSGDPWMPEPGTGPWGPFNGKPPNPAQPGWYRHPAGHEYAYPPQ